MSNIQRVDPTKTPLRCTDCDRPAVYVRRTEHNADMTVTWGVCRHHAKLTAAEFIALVDTELEQYSDALTPAMVKEFLADMIGRKEDR